jgi:hypothetical protein
MPFSLAGSNTLTISGTETLATAFADAFNSPSGDNGTYVDRQLSVETGYFYTIKALRLIVTGTLNIDNSLLFATPADTQYWPPLQINAGTVNIGSEQTISSVLYGSGNPLFLGFRKEAFIGTGQFQYPWQWGGSLIAIFSGGNLNIYGAEIQFKEGGLIGTRNSTATNGTPSSANIIIKNSRIVTKGTLTNSETRSRISVGTASGTTLNLTVEDLTFVGTGGVGGFLEVYRTSSAGTLNDSISDYKARGCIAGFQFNDGITGKTYSKFDFRGCPNGVLVNQNAAKVVTFLDNAQGNAMNVAFTSSGVRGTVLLSATIAFSSTQNFITRLVDTNNGSRKSAYSSNYVNTGTLSGGILNQAVITGIHHKDDASTPALDSRLPYSGVARLYGYSEYALAISTSLAQPLPIPAVLDPEITQATKATVDAYSGFTFNSGTTTLTLAADLTNAQVYDRIRSYLVDNMGVARFGAFTKVANRLTIDWSLSLSVGLSAGGVIAFVGTTLDLSTTATQLRVFEIGATQIVTVADGTTNLTTWTFASGATINRRAGATASTVQVASVTGITAGSGVTLVAPVLTVTITGLTATTRLKIYNTGTQTLVAGVNSSSTSFEWTGATIGNGYDIYAVLPGKLPRVLRNYIFPSASTSLPFAQDDDTSYVATSGLAIDSASGANLGTSSDIYINISTPSAVLIQMATGFGLSQPTGITWQRLYSRVMEARYAADTYMPYDGLIVPTSVTAGEFVMTRSTELADATTRNLVRNGGVRYLSTAGATTAEYCNITGIGSLQTPASTTGYFVQDSATNATTTNFVNPGQPNQMIQIYGDSTHGNLDRRSFLAVYARRLGEAGTRYDVVAAEGTLKPQQYKALLSTSTDLIATITADTQIDANADGTPDVAPYSGMSITWQVASGFHAAWANGFAYPANSVVGSAGRFYRTTAGGTSSGTGVADDSGVTWAAYAGERQINGVYRCFQTITNLNGASYEFIRNYHNWANRQTVDIDAGTVNRTGRVASTLSTSRGSQVILSTGGYVDNFEASDSLSIIPVDVFGTERPLPAPPPTISVNGFQPLSSVTISYAGQTLAILNDTSPPFSYTLSADFALPATLSLVITKSGFETYAQGVAVVDRDVAVTVAQTPEGSSDVYSSPQVEFQSLMIADAGFLRVLAGATAGLADEVKSVRLANFTDAAVKASWALLVAQTVPTSGEIIIWQGYLTSTGYEVISFNSSTGVVS